MYTITKYLALAMLCLIMQIINAQDSIQKINNQEKIEALKAFKETIKNQERDFLKTEVEAINARVDNGELTTDEATVLKKESAKKRALNIENRIAIVDNQISLYERNAYPTDDESDKENKIGVMISNKTFNIKGTKKEPKYDLRTSNDFLFAIGFNNALVDGKNFDDSPYKKGGSGFVEIGWNWKTRVCKNSEFLRFKYGISLQWNKLNPKNNQYFVQNGSTTTLEEFPTNLKKSKFRATNLVLPVHFEFGPLKKLDRNDRIRYINNNQFKIGLGGYAGLNIGTQQKLKYNENGNDIKEKIRRDFNTNDFVYGLSGYIGFGDTALYVKYDLSPIFKNQLIEQNNISIGIRFDVD